MPEIIQLTGKLNFTLTLDPSSWLFDDRKINLEALFDDNIDHHEENIKKRDLLKHDYTLGVPLQPFLNNAEPHPEAKTVTFETVDGDYSFPYPTAAEGLMAFTKEGKFLKSDGPAHFYLKDGSNRQHPITNIRKITVS